MSLLDMFFKKKLAPLPGVTESSFSCVRDGLTIRGTEYRPEGENLPIAIVSHGCALRCYQCHAAGLPISEIDNLLIARNASVSCVIYDGDDIRVEFYDDHSFLSDLGERVNYV